MQFQIFNKSHIMKQFIIYKNYKHIDNDKSSFT